jgi:predicted N-acetyltransferase YhbS
MISSDKIILRLETPADQRAVEQITREAFWNLHFPGCDEHYLVHVLRKSPDFIAELNYVAVYEDKVIGNIMYAHSIIRGADNQVHKALTFGPVCVLPQYQQMGIGRLLITHTLKLAREMGFGIVGIYGYPEYYSKYGFEPAEKYNIRTKDGMFIPALQVLELIPNALSGISGHFVEADVYNLDADEVDKFDATFPYKEKAVTPSQTRFQEALILAHY